MKIFLSAVSGQFRDCRNALASDLRKIGAEVKVQEDFQQHPWTLMKKLEEDVAGCDRVIALVGDAYGFEPAEEARPAGQPRRSYTQWEYAFAIGERLDGSDANRKDLYVYFADTKYLDSHPVQQDAEQADLQQQFIAAIRKSGKHYGSFDSLDALCRLVLADGLQVRNPDRKPNTLPFHTLGTLFKGREPFLEELRGRLRGPNGDAAAIVAPRVLHGLGGVGKTRTAIEYAWRFAADYRALLFVSAPSASDLRARLSDLVGVLEIDTPDTAVEPRLAEVLRWLDTHPGWLLILDNIDTTEAVAAVQALLARLTAGHVLITSRISNWLPGVEPLELDLLAEADAVAFLLDRTPHRRVKPDDPATAATIARELDRLALALEQAGAYIDKMRLSFAEYLKRWQARRAEVLHWHDPASMDYPVSVAVTWETTFAQLNPAEQRLLSVLSWLAPEPVPLSFFESESLAAAVPEPRAVLAGLAGYSLVRFAGSDDAVEVHRLVQEITRGRAAGADREPMLRLALEIVTALVPGDPEDVRTWPVWAPLSPHAAAVTSHADAAATGEPTAALMNQLGLYLKARGQFSAAEPLMRRTLAIDERAFGNDHPGVARDLNNLALLLHATNRLQEAEPLMRQAVAIHERAFGNDHPDVATALNNLALLLHATNRLDEAEPLMRRTLASRERAFGTDHPKVATALNNLVLLLHATNRLDEAEPLMRRAVAIDERAFGTDHPNVATALNNLARLLQDTNRLEGAEPLMRRTLAIFERAFGTDHPKVATALNNLARLLHATSRLEEAEPMMWRALAIDERAFGTDHPDVATRLNSLARLLQDTNRLEEAEPMMRRAVAILVAFRRKTGHEHPKFRAGVANYQGLLTEMGRSPEQIDDALRA